MLFDCFVQIQCCLVVTFYTRSDTECAPHIRQFALAKSMTRSECQLYIFFCMPAEADEVYDVDGDQKGKKNYYFYYIWFVIIICVADACSDSVVTFYFLFNTKINRWAIVSIASDARTSVPHTVCTDQKSMRLQQCLRTTMIEKRIFVLRWCPRFSCGNASSAISASARFLMYSDLYCCTSSA